MRAYVRNVMQGGVVVAPIHQLATPVRYRTRTPVARASRVHAQSREEYDNSDRFDVTVPGRRAAILVAPSGANPTWRRVLEHGAEDAMATLQTIKARVAGSREMSGRGAQMPCASKIGAMRSSGMGNRMVEFCSLEISERVCR